MLSSLDSSADLFPFNNDKPLWLALNSSVNMAVDSDAMQVDGETPQTNGTPDVKDRKY